MSNNNEQKISTCLWFEKEAEEAAKYYVSIFSEKFPDSKIGEVSYYDKASSEVSGQSEGAVMMVELKLGGQEFLLLNGGKLPEGWSKVSPATSFVINCENQDEVDWFWSKLSEGGKKSVCGWIEYDKYGITWQVTPTILPKMLADPDKEKASRVMAAMLKMDKIDIAELEKAYMAG